MAIPYPEGLPYPSRNGYGLQHVSPIQRTEMQSGRAKMRQRFTSTPSIVSVSWTMDQGQALLFEGWFRYQLNDGTLWGDLPLQSPMGIKPYEARFVDIYDGPELVGVDHWRYTAEVELRERPTMDRDWILYGPEYVRFGSIFDIAMNRDWPEQ